MGTGPDESLEDQVEGQRRIVRKGHAVVVTGVEEPAYEVLGLLYFPVGTQGIAVGRPGRIAIEAARQGLRDSVGDTGRLLYGRRGVIEIIHHLTSKKKAAP